MGTPLRFFLRGSTDYSRANSKGSRGVYLWYWLEEGKLYDVYSFVSWGRADRRYVLCDSAGIHRVDKTEALAWLKVAAIASAGRE